MTLPHTYTDEADHTLKVTDFPGPRLVTKTTLPTEDEQGVVEHVASVTAPKGADAVALARAVLEAAGDTGHRVVSEEHIKDLEAAAGYVAARSMRERAAQEVLFQPGTRVPMAISEAISALPLLPDA